MAADTDDSAINAMLDSTASTRMNQDDANYQNVVPKGVGICQADDEWCMEQPWNLFNLTDPANIDTGMGSLLLPRNLFASLIVVLFSLVLKILTWLFFRIGTLLGWLFYFKPVKLELMLTRQGAHLGYTVRKEWADKRKAKKTGA